MDTREPGDLHVDLFTSLEPLQVHASAWDRLAGSIPFRSWTWMSTWWQHYGPRASAARRGDGLFVLAVFDSTRRLQAVAPWYQRRVTGQGRVLEWLGTGEVCSDYLGVLCQPAASERVASALSDWLCDPQRSRAERWDLLKLSAVDKEDEATRQLAEALRVRGCRVHQRERANCWRIELPAEWEQYLACLSKSHRKQLRQLERRMIDSGRAVLHTARQTVDFAPAFQLLRDLHQRRRATLGQPGCFASPQFTAFHQDVSCRLGALGQCLFHWLEIDGRPAAVEYHFRASGVNYAYQLGIEPDLIDLEPGRLITTALLRQAIQAGDRAMDFLRGDEPYKSHFRAQPRPSVEYRIAAPRRVARCRLQILVGAEWAKQWLRSSRDVFYVSRQHASSQDQRRSGRLTRISHDPTIITRRVSEDRT